MQSFFLTTTPPPFLWEYAPVGQAITQGAGSQARQSRASNPVERPPEDLMRIPAVSQDRRLCTIRAQASEQEWHPMQRSILGVGRIFKTISPYYLLYIRGSAPDPGHLSCAAKQGGAKEGRPNENSSRLILPSSVRDETRPARNHKYGFRTSDSHRGFTLRAAVFA